MTTAQILNWRLQHLISALTSSRELKPQFSALTAAGSIRMTHTVSCGLHRKSAVAVAPLDPVVGRILVGKILDQRIDQLAVTFVPLAIDLPLLAVPHRHASGIRAHMVLAARLVRLEDASKAQFLEALCGQVHT